MNTYNSSILCFIEYIPGCNRYANKKQKETRIQLIEKHESYVKVVYKLRSKCKRSHESYVKTVFKLVPQIGSCRTCRTSIKQDLTGSSRRIGLEAEPISPEPV